MTDLLNTNSPEITWFVSLTKKEQKRKMIIKWDASRDLVLIKEGFWVFSVVLDVYEVLKMF